MLMRPFLRPWEGFREFEVFTPSTGLTDAGRPKAGGWESKGKVIAALTQASPAEIEQAKQAGHPITHRVVQAIVNFSAAPKDRLILGEDKEKRVFLIQNLRNPGSLNHCIVYYCEERADLND